MDEMPLDPERRRGRGAGANPSGRFEATQRVEADDGWDIPEDRAAFRTQVTEERPRRAITRNASPDVPFERSLNPYRGCEHGCIYCFARPTHAYLGFSAGLDFETRLVARPSIPEVLDRELRAGRYVPGVLAMGTNTDPYQPVERDYGIVRRVLEVLCAFQHPVGIVTKGTLVGRDADILGEMAGSGLAEVGVTVTTLDPDLSRALEPRVPMPARRLEVIRQLAQAGIPVRVMVAPIIPGLTCHEIEPILTAAREAGAVAASWTMLRLPHEVAPLFRAWLEEHRPDRAARVMARVREAHGGRDYDPQWGKRMTGVGTYAALLAQRVRLAKRRLGLDAAQPALRTDLFRVPPRPGDQLDLFG